MRTHTMRLCLVAAGALGCFAVAQGAITLEPEIDRPGQDLRPGFDLPAADPGLCMKACEEDRACQAFTYVKPGVQGPSARCWLKSGVPAAVKSDCCVSGVRDSAARAAGRAAVTPIQVPAPGRAISSADLPIPTPSPATAAPPPPPPAGVPVATVPSSKAARALAPMTGQAVDQETGVDRPGSNLKPGFDLPAADAALCRQACDAEPACRAWTYVKPGIQGPNARCWLKSGVPVAEKNDCCVSGVRKALTESVHAAGTAAARQDGPSMPVVTPGISTAGLEVLKTLAADYSGYEIGIDRPGGNYRDFVLEDPRPDLCRAACDGDSKCNAFTFVRGGFPPSPKAHCWLKSSATAKRLDSNCISGLRTKIVSGAKPLSAESRSFSSASEITINASLANSMLEMLMGKPVQEVNAALVGQQREMHSKAIQDVLSVRQRVNFEGLAPRPEVLALVVGGMSEAEAEAKVTALRQAEVSGVHHVGTRPTVQGAIGLSNQAPLNTVDERGGLLIFGKGFGAIPGRVQLRYFTQKEEFSPANAHTMELVPLTGDWGSSWSDDLIAVRIPVLTEPWLTEQSQGWVQSFFVSEPSPRLEIHAAGGSGNQVEHSVRVERQPSFGTSGYTVTPRGMSSEYRYAVTAGSLIQVFGRGFGDSGVIWLDFHGEVLPYGKSEPVGRQVLAIESWQDSLIVARVPYELLQGNYPFVPAMLSLRPDTGQGFVESWGVMFGPKMELYLTSGQEYFFFDAQDDADRATVSGAVMTVYHNPGCGIQGNGGYDYFFREKVLPPNATLYGWTVVQHKPGDPESLALQVVGKSAGEMLTNVLTGNAWGLAKQFGGYLIGWIFAGSDWGKYGVHATKSKTSDTIAVEWDTTCAPVEYEGKEAVYSAMFSVWAPAGSVNTGPEAAIITR